ncbi:MAG TPA: CaiB/BaiF CoA-transferase family protein [Acidobacteriota bacterium]|nr:CaiB/BaiF CoA-transferase family protein [Acidobacteriota bacterium]
MSFQQSGLPLRGVRVLDFSRVLAGPYCTMMLADLGADVIKVESPRGGDETRGWGPPYSGPPEERRSAYFLSVNRNKRSLCLDLKSPEGLERARRLARRSQVVIENFRPGKAEELGLGYPALRRANPSLVYCSISGFGQSGPYRERPGYDYVIQAMSGLMSVTGPVEGPPCKVGVAISDVLAGLHASTAVLGALYEARRSGRGRLIDISLLDCQIASLVNVAANYLVSGERPLRRGHQHPNIVPYQTFQARDGAFVVAVGNDRQFQRLCRLLGCPQLAEDERFATNPDRSRHRDELVPLLQEEFRRRRCGEWVEELLRHGIPAGPIRELPEVFGDSHVEQRELVDRSQGLALPRSPMHLDGQALPIRQAPPLLGEHNSEILRELASDLDEREDERA